MDLKDIKFILDLDSESNVNKYLQKGWVLINTYTTTHDPDICKNHLYMHYIIGAPVGVDYSKELSQFNLYSRL